jgi:hypothetical protein
MQTKNLFTRSMRVLIAIVALVAVTGCSGQPLSTREKGTLVGGAVGAGTGAIVGGAVGAPGAGAAIGGVVGAGTGLAVGNALQNQEARNAANRAAFNRHEHELNRHEHEINSDHQHLNDLSTVE